MTEAKTRLVAQALSQLVGDASALVVLPQKDESYNTTMRTMKNLDDAKVLLAGYLNIRDLFSYEKLVMPVATLDALVAKLG
jgi:large subunit ribosomal protein L4